MENNKKNFEQRFSKYLDSKLNNQKKNQLFAGQFSSPPPKNQPQGNTSIFPFSGLKTKNLTQSQNAQKQPKEEEHMLKKKSSKSKQRRVSEQSSVFKRKRLKKLRQIEQNVCPICLDQITKRCQLDCKHKFCLDCLQKWFQTSNKCPFCRFEVKSYWYKGEQYFVERREAQEDLSDYDSEYEDGYFSEASQNSQFSQDSLDYTCYNCDETQPGDIVLICDRCEVNSCHVRCDERLRGRQPRGEWYCHFCR